MKLIIGTLVALTLAGEMAKGDTHRQTRIGKGQPVNYYWSEEGVLINPTESSKGWIIFRVYKSQHSLPDLLFRDNPVPNPETHDIPHGRG